MKPFIMTLLERRKFLRLSVQTGLGITILSGLPSCRNQPPQTPFVDRILPAPLNGGFQDPDFWIWGASVIKGEDGNYHMFASRWSREVGFANWVTNSEVVRAVSATAVGPYEFQEVVLPIRGKSFFDGMCTHNPRIIKYKNKYLLYYFGTTYDFPLPDASNPVVNQENWANSWMNKRIGLAISDSVMGPWKRLDKPVIEPRPDHWDASITSNPAPAVDQKTGKILLMYKSSTDGLTPPLLLGVCSAENPEGPYHRLSVEPILRFETGGNNKRDVEDPFIWWNKDHFEAILKDRSGEICGEEGGWISNPFICSYRYGS